MPAPDSDAANLLTVASVTAGFGIAALVFRIQRELQMAACNETTWVPKADWLLITATLLALLAVILPILMAGQMNSSVVALASIPAVFSVVLLAGYMFAILAHYRLIFGGCRSGPRENPEPAEKKIIVVTITVGTIVALLKFMQIHPLSSMLGK
jgi:hypothetical protein